MMAACDPRLGALSFYHCAACTEVIVRTGKYLTVAAIYRGRNISSQEVEEVRSAYALAASRVLTDSYRLSTTSRPKTLPSSQSGYRTVRVFSLSCIVLELQCSRTGLLTTLCEVPPIDQVRLARYTG